MGVRTRSQGGGGDDDGDPQGGGRARGKGRAEAWGHSGKRSVLWEDFGRSASVTTIEPKFAVSPNIAEFFCCITSPAYAWPAFVIWFDSPPAQAPLALHFVLVQCCLTAIFSTVYHATLWKLFSSLDAGQAVCNFYSIALLLAGVTDMTTHLVTTAALISVFCMSWRRTAKISLVLVAFVVTPMLYVMWMRGEEFACFAFVTGVLSFLLDRYQFLPLHSLWHIAVSYTATRACRTFAAAYSDKACHIAFWTFHTC